MPALEIFKQVWLLWLSLLTTIAFFIVTIIFAAAPETFSNVTYATESFGRPILVLRVLSGVTSILLFATYSAILERTQWLIVMQHEMMPFTRFLALHNSTGYLGLSSLAFGKHGMDTSARMIATTRLFIAGFCGVLGIIIMSDVQSSVAYQHIQKYATPAGNGASDLNASLAILPAMMADSYFGQRNMLGFLDGPSELVVDITPEYLQDQRCNSLRFSGPTSTCERTIFMVGSAPREAFMEDLLPNADVMTGFATQGYVLAFGKGDVDTDHPWKFNDETDCKHFGASSGGFVQLCIQNVRANKILVRMVPCPLHLSISKRCLSNTSWHSNTTAALSTSLTATFRWADVAYHRANGTILSHAFTSRPEQDAPIKGEDLLRAYDIFANGTQAFLGLFDGILGSSKITVRQDTTATTFLDDIVDSISNMDLDALGGSSAISDTAGRGDITSIGDVADPRHDFPGQHPMFVLLLGGLLTSCSVLGTENSRIPRFCHSILQNFVAIPLHLCNRLRLAQGLETGALDLFGLPKTPALGGIMSQLGMDDASIRRVKEETIDNVVALSKLRYQIHVGRTSLMVYAIISGFILLVCLVALIVASFYDLECSSFPLWDFLRLQVTRRYGAAVAGDEREALDADSHFRDGHTKNTMVAITEHDVSMNKDCD